MGEKGQGQGPVEVSCRELFEAAQEYQVRELSFWVCANMVANALGRCEFRTFRGHEEIQEKEYYLWNVSPNVNQNSSAFLHKLVARLYQNNEALIVNTLPRPDMDALVVADSWEEPDAWPSRQNEYRGVTVGDYTYQYPVYEANALHLKLNHTNMRPILNGLYQSYWRMVSAAMKAYQWDHGQHWKVHVSQLAQGGDKFQESFQQMITEQLKPFFDSDGAILPEFDGYAYYQKLSAAMRDRDPKQAVTNLDLVMPETVVDAVFDELQTSHPLLSHIQFMNTRGAIRMMMNTNGYQTAAWGQLCAEIVQELTSGFKEVDTGLLKLSAFLPVCKAMLELGPEWLDNFVRQVLYEAYANGLEAGIVAGNGKPIGMNRQVGDNVTVTGGVYPKKNPVTVTDLSPTTYGRLLAMIAVDPNGKARVVRDVILVVNPVDYFNRIMPATTIMRPDGTYANDVLP